MLAQLVKQNRSCRRFNQNFLIDYKVLEELIDLARLSASAANLQPLKYILSNKSKINAKIFDCLKWAAYLKQWSGPDEGQQPSAYITVLGDNNISKNIQWDHGIASQTILLGAREKNLAGCIIASIDKKRLQTVLEIPENLEVLLVLAIGKPIEEVVIDNIGTNGSIKYWRDKNDIHHVPKRTLQDIIIKVSK